MLPGEDFYLEAFDELSTTRSFGMVAGPIPWNHMVGYADRVGLSRETSNIFVQVLRALDHAWLGWQEDERKRNMPTTPAVKRKTR